MVEEPAPPHTHTSANCVKTISLMQYALFIGSGACHGTIISTVRSVASTQAPRWGKSSFTLFCWMTKSHTQNLVSSGRPFSAMKHSRASNSCCGGRVRWGGRNFLMCGHQFPTRANASIRTITLILRAQLTNTSALPTSGEPSRSSTWQTERPLFCLLYTLIWYWFTERVVWLRIGIVR